MIQQMQLALMADNWALPPSARLVALILLIGFAIFTVAAVPVEYRFFQRVHSRALPWMVALELLVVLLIVLALAGLILEWFTGTRGVLMAAWLLTGLWIILIVYLLLRVPLTYRAYLGQRADAKTSREALERLLATMQRNQQAESADEEADEQAASPQTPTGEPSSNAQSGEPRSAKEDER